jgi:hypothetical protein
VADQLALLALPVVPLRWRVSAAWSRRAHDCTLAGIEARCHGGCCYGPTYWPAVSYPGGPEGGPCGNLGPEGCRWSGADRPVTCLLYPLRLNRAGMLVLHHRTTTASSICKGNHGQGPALIDAMEYSLTSLFGAEQYARVRAEVMAGRDTYFEVPAEVLASYELEQAQEAVREQPVPRTTQRAPLPVLA